MSIPVGRRMWLAGRLRALADEEERAGRKEFADDFRTRAEIVGQIKPDLPKG